jgi:hypothetical protein
MLTRGPLPLPPAPATRSVHNNAWQRRLGDAARHGKQVEALKAELNDLARSNWLLSDRNSGKCAWVSVLDGMRAVGPGLSRAEAGQAEWGRV